MVFVCWQDDLTLQLSPIRALNEQGIQLHAATAGLANSELFTPVHTVWLRTFDPGAMTDHIFVFGFVDRGRIEVLVDQDF